MVVVMFSGIFFFGLRILGQKMLQIIMYRSAAPGLE
jgi:hypothetical protein